MPAGTERDNMDKPAANDIIVTFNEYRTAFVSLVTEAGTVGEMMADSATFNRQRGFNNKQTSEWMPAADFTKKQIAKLGASHVGWYLAATGTNIDGRRVWMLDGSRLVDLGTAPTVSA